MALSLCQLSKEAAAPALSHEVSDVFHVHFAFIIETRVLYFFTSSIIPDTTCDVLFQLAFMTDIQDIKNINELPRKLQPKVLLAMLGKSFAPSICGHDVRTNTEAPDCVLAPQILIVVSNKSVSLVCRASRERLFSSCLVAVKRIY